MVSDWPDLKFQTANHIHCCIPTLSLFMKTNVGAFAGDLVRNTRRCSTSTLKQQVSGGRTGYGHALSLQL